MKRDPSVIGGGDAGVRSGWMGRNFPSLVFYTRLMFIYYRAWRLARKGIYTDERWRASSADARRALESVGVRFDIQGLEVLDRLKGPCVLVANHMSTLETFVLPSLVPLSVPVTFVVKASLLRYPVFGKILGARDPVAVGRKDPRDDLKKVLEGGAARLARGISIIVFPQTTRSEGFDPSRFNTIGVKLARRAGAPVIPVALTSAAWQVGGILKDFGPIDPRHTVRFRFGEPVPVSGTGREAHEQVVRFISGHMREWGEEVKGE